MTIRAELSQEEIARRAAIVREAGLRKGPCGLTVAELDQVLEPLDQSPGREQLRLRQAVSNRRRARPKQERVERWATEQIRAAGHPLSVPELVERGCEASETLLRRLAVAMVARGELVRRAEGRPTERKRSDGSPMRVLVPVTVYSLPAGVEEVDCGER